MKILDRKLFRDFHQTGGLMAAIAAIMAIGIMCFVTLGNSYQNLTVAQIDYYSDCRMADFWVSLNKAPIPDAQAIENLPGIVRVQTRLKSNITIDLPNVSRPINGQLISLPEMRQPILNDVLIQRGEYFTNDREEEVLVNNAFAKAHSIYPGSTVKVIVNNRLQSLFVVGTVASSEFLYVAAPGEIIPDPTRFGILYAKRRFLEDLMNYEGACNEIVGLMSPEARQYPDRYLDRIETHLEDYGVFSTTPRKDQVSHQVISTEIDQLSKFSYVLPGIFLTVAALILNVLMGRMIEQQRTIVGTMKALGASDYEVMSHYAKFGLILGVLGGVVGCFFGYLLSILQTSLYQTVFEFPNLTNLFHPQTYLTALSINLIFCVIGIFFSIRRALQLEPAEAMRPPAPQTGKAVWLEHFPLIWSRLTPHWRMAFRNVIRHRSRTGAGLFAAAMGSALLINSLSLNTGLNYLSQFQFSLVDRSDAQITLKDTHSQDVLHEIDLLPAVDRMEPLLNVSCHFRNGSHEKRAAITGLVPNAQLTVPRNREAKPLRIPPMGLVMGRSLADQLHLRPGDYVMMKPVRGEQSIRQLPVISISEGYLGLSCYADISYLSQIVGEERAMTEVQLQTNPRPEMMRAFEREIKKFPALAGYRMRQASLDKLDELLQANLAAITMLCLFSGAIFFGSTLNAALVSLAERQREVATLIVLGYEPWFVGLMFFREGFLVSMLGTIIGLPLGYFLAYSTVNAIATDMMRFPLKTPFWIFVMTFFLGVIFTLAAQYFVQRSINKTDWQDKLNVKE
ncbi:ABC transporter permease [Planctomycetales bacterium 10988]|nr:ABC transporter permease [Planctomycetales bacterium 10988]